MAFEGYIDNSSATELNGWVFDNSRPDTPLELEILDGGQVIARITAKRFREDLLGAGKGNGAHAFSFTAASPAKEGLRARVLGKRWFIPKTGGSSAQNALPIRFDATLAHCLEYGIPAGIEEQGFSSAISAGDNVELGQRLIRAYKKTVEDNPANEKRKNDQWTDVEAGFHQEILSLVEREDARGLMLHLQDAHAKGITRGISQGDVTTGVLRRDPEARRLVMLMTLDYLTSLAEYLGILDVENPEQHGQWGENIQCDPLALAERVSQAAGVFVAPPQVIGSSFGLRTGHGIVNTRDVLSLYAALRIRSILNFPKDGGVPSASVCEIGGGFGGVAYYANRLGAAQYTIIDLPLVSLLQGYFLIRALPEARIALYGEEVAGAAIKLLPTYAFATSKDPFDLLLNQDSMPEIHRDYSVGYLTAAVEKKIPLFLSINQEARAPQSATELQTVIRELVGQAGGYRPAYRFRHWIRAGYVEEMFSLPQSG